MAGKSKYLHKSLTEKSKVKNLSTSSNVKKEKSKRHYVKKSTKLENEKQSLVQVEKEKPVNSKPTFAQVVKKGKPSIKLTTISKPKKSTQVKSSTSKQQFKNFPQKEDWFTHVRSVVKSWFS